MVVFVGCVFSVKTVPCACCIVKRVIVIDKESSVGLYVDDEPLSRQLRRGFEHNFDGFQRGRKVLDTEIMGLRIWMKNGLLMADTVLQRKNPGYKTNKMSLAGWQWQHCSKIIIWLNSHHLKKRITNGPAYPLKEPLSKQIKIVSLKYV